MKDNRLKSGERQVHDTFKGIEFWHKWRYTESLRYVRDMNVLDVGCGCGYGAAILELQANSIVGIDDNAEAVRYANDIWRRHNIDFWRMSFLDYKENGFRGFNFDVIVAFEVIEHIEDTQTVFDNFKLCGPQKIIFSIPHVTTPMGANKFHYRHFGSDEILSLFMVAGYKPKRYELRYFDRDMVSRNNLNIFGVMEKV